MGFFFRESYLSISIYHFRDFFFQSVNELRWLSQPQYVLELYSFFSEQTKRETTCEIKMRHSHHLSKKMLAFCFCFYEMDTRAFSVFSRFFEIFRWMWTVNTEHTLIVIGGGVFTHLLLMRLFVSFDLAIFWPSICQASLYISGMEKTYNYHTLRFNHFNGMCVLLLPQLVHSTSCAFSIAFAPIRMSN